MSPMAPVSRDELTSEQRTVLQKRQLEIDVRNVLTWLTEAEERSVGWLESIPSDISSLGKLCAQYKVCGIPICVCSDRIMSKPRQRTPCKLIDHSH